MSDRLGLMNIFTGHGKDGLEMYRDGESGTWRLFLQPNGELGDCVDFSLQGLKDFHMSLGCVLSDIEKYPDMCNAEERRKVAAEVDG